MENHIDILTRKPTRAIWRVCSICSRATLLFIACAIALSFSTRTPAGEDRDVDRNQPHIDARLIERLHEQLEQSHSAMQNARVHLNKGAFELNFKLNQLDYESSEIIEFSKSSIAYEQYPGVLRGRRGTLFARAGNAIDQSLFLAGLLRDAGYEARIAYRKISSDQALKVLDAMKQPIVPPAPFVDAEHLLHAIEQQGEFPSDWGADRRQELLERLDSNSIAADTSEYEEVLLTAELVRNALEGADVEFEVSHVMAELVEEAREYYWVQFRDDISGGWKDVHPIFVSEGPFESLTAQSFIADDVPESLQHRLRIQMFVERKKGNKLQIIPVTTAWERPIANLVATPVTLSNFSDSMMAGHAYQNGLESHLRQSGSFVVALGNTMAPGAQFFDLSGNVIDPMAAQDSAAGVFASINEAFSSSIGRLGAEQSLPTLTAQWIEFTLIAPGGRESVIHKITLDRIGISARRENEIPSELGRTTAADARQLLQRHTFMVDVGNMPRGYVIEAIYQHFKNIRPGIEALLAFHSSPGEPPNSVPRVPIDWHGFPSLYRAFAMVENVDPNVRIYRHAPGLVVFSDGLGPGERSFRAIDILSNPRRAIDVTTDVPTPSPDHLILAGVWETRMEGAVLNDDGGYSTWKAFEEAGNAGVKPIVIVPGQRFESPEHDPDITAAIQSDLDTGFAIVTPERVTSPENAGWWRVSLRDGQTLGRINSGLGGDLLERVLVTSMAYGGLIYGVTQCDGLEGDAMVCCLAAAGGASVAGLGVGFGLQGMLGVLATGVIEFNSALLPTSGICDALF